MEPSALPIALLGQGWRKDLALVISSARRSVILAAPFVKQDIAAWVRNQVPPDVELTMLANIRADAVASGALDISALLYIARNIQRARILALPNLHAKVFVADDTAAIITSGNLTASGLDRNLEYGVLLRERSLVVTVRRHMRSYARLGSALDAMTLADLLPLEADLRNAHAQSRNAVLPEARKRLADVVRQAKPRLAGVQVGNRSANAVFGEAIRLVLADGPRSTTELGSAVRELLPDLCDDTEELVINGEGYGKAWKHRLRNAQQHLKRQGVVTYDSKLKLWALSRET